MEQEMQPNYWWYAYGHFPVGIGNMPHAGRVIAFYRDLRGWDQDQFAAEMGLGKRRIYQIEESAVLKSSSRREVLVKLLNIPPALLGVMALQYLPDQAVALNPSTTEAYEGVLSLAWSAYYSSNAHESATTVAL